MLYFKSVCNRGDAALQTWYPATSMWRYPSQPWSCRHTFEMCTFNMCSLLNPLKFTAISDLVESRHIDLFDLTETWIISSSIAELWDATQPGLIPISFLRPTQVTESHIQHSLFVNLLLFFQH